MAVLAPWDVLKNEASGALNGLTRVQRFQQDDAHIICRESQGIGQLPKGYAREFCSSSTAPLQREVQMDQQLQQTQEELGTTQQTIEHQQKIIDSPTAHKEQYASRLELTESYFGI